MTPRGAKPGHTEKARQTRERILTLSLKLFQDRGFNETHMRDIAAAAGLSLGAAYYYFKSKDDIVMAYYRLCHQEQVEQSREIFKATRDARERMELLIRGKLRDMLPYRRFLGGLFAKAGDPESELSPFGPQTADIRNEAVAVFGELIASSSLRLHKDFQGPMPRLFWLFQMAVILCWIYDRTPNSARTDTLIRRGLDLVFLLIKVVQLPLMGAIRRTVLQLIQDMLPREGDGAVAAPIAN